MNIKDDIHQLVDNTNDEELLVTYYRLLQQLSSDGKGSLWAKLTAAQQEELLISYNESLEQDYLVSHHDVKASNH